MANRIRVLTFVDFYLPGYKAGGPIRTIFNMIERLSDDVEFLIFTRDHDLGEKKPYKDVISDDWNKVGNASVYYVSQAKFTLARIAKLMRETSYDVVYLNSFFSPKGTLLPLLVRRLQLCPSRPVIIASRGEFSPGAINIKGLKKRTYIALTKVIGLYNDLVWQASSINEQQDIKRVLGNVASEILVAPNLLPPNWIFSSSWY